MIINWKLYKSIVNYVYETKAITADHVSYDVSISVQEILEFFLQ